MLAALFGNTCDWPKASGDYWQQSRRLLACLALVAPLLLLYEGGMCSGSARKPCVTGRMSGSGSFWTCWASASIFCCRC